MSAAQTPLLQKQQNKPPTSMRYERVQDILQNDLALKPLLGPKNHPVSSRFGENILFSKEVVEVTQAIHAEGKDAHKVTKNEILRMAMRVMKIAPLNGAGELRLVVSVSEPPVAPPVPTPLEKKKQKLKSASKPKTGRRSTVASPDRQERKPEPVPATKSSKIKKSSAAKPAKASTKSAKPVKVTRQSKTVKPESPKPTPVASSVSRVRELEPEGPAELPESELPPEKQPLHLPAAFDPKKYPHYDVQSTAYSLLLSCLTVVSHYEKYPGFEERQKKLESVLKDYLETCNQIKVGE